MDVHNRRKGGIEIVWWKVVEQIHIVLGDVVLHEVQLVLMERRLPDLHFRYSFVDVYR